MRDLNYELKQLCQRNHDGSYATRHAREAILTQIANQLHELGFRDMKATSLKPKHVTGLVELWKSQSLSAGTIKNRMTELRWWAEKVNKRNVMARDNEHYGIARRQYVTMPHTFAIVARSRPRHSTSSSASSPPAIAP